MARSNSGTKALIVAALVARFASPAQAQILSGAGASSVAISAAKVEVLSLAVAGGPLASTDIATTPDLGNLTATLDWSLSPARGNVYLVGWFATANALGDGAGNDVTTASVLGRCTSSSLAGSTCSNTLTAFSASDAVVGAAGASLVLWTSPGINGTTRNESGVAVGLNFQLDPTAVASLPAATYSGTLFLRAYAQ